MRLTHRSVALAAFAALSVAGCADEPVPVPAGPPTVTAYHGELSAELRGTAKTVLHLGGGNDAVDVRLLFDGVDTQSLFDPSVPLAATGRREPFPEARSELYTATFALPPSTSSACGADQVTLALALLRREPNVRFGGSLSAYCGPKAVGVPVRIFRLSGDLEPR